ncbi:MAG: recombinase family protein [Candidatus Obscuribacterales bacterium]|nr:recombinase family protein [Candidatus Obscuribacterales bacterium]
MAKTVAIYCRVSTDDQDCDRQVRDLTEHAGKLGYTIYEVFKETASGAKNDRAIRKQVLTLAQARKIDGILVTEMSRWGRSTVDLITTLQELDSWGVSLIAQTGFTFDLTTAQGKLIANIMASLAEFERELIRERVKSGLAAAKARGKKLGRQEGDNFKQDKYERRILKLRADGRSYRDIATELKLDKNTVMKVIKKSQVA